MNSRLANVLTILLLVFTVLAGCAPAPAPAAAVPTAVPETSQCKKSEHVDVEPGNVKLDAEPLQLDVDGGQATLRLTNIKNNEHKQQTLYITVIGETKSIPLTEDQLKEECVQLVFTGTIASGHTYDAVFSTSASPASDDVEPLGGTHCCAAKAP